MACLKEKTATITWLFSKKSLLFLFADNIYCSYLLTGYLICTGEVPNLHHKGVPFLHYRGTRFALPTKTRLFGYICEKFVYLHLKNGFFISGKGIVVE